MRDNVFPVLWINGQPGSGKSAVGWALYDEIARSGTRVGFVDIDQLGIFLPAPLDDPERYRLKVSNVSSTVENFRASGCDALIVSGELGISTAISADTVHGASLTVCRLQASPGELRRRLTVRGAPANLAAAWVREAEEPDRSSLADTCVDTEGRTISDVARLVRERCGDWPPPYTSARTAATGPALSPAAGADGEVLLLCGATGAGKSSVGFEVFRRQLRARHTAAYLDLGQLGLLSPPPAGDPGGHRLRARNLADFWRAYHKAGARRLVMSGPVPDAHTAASYAAALPAADVTVCRLHAGRAELARRIALRGRSFDWPEPGDPLIGRSDTYLRQAAEAAATTAEALDRSSLGDVRIDTDGLSVAEAADLVGRCWRAPLSSTVRRRSQQARGGGSGG
ncbi:hypothetical protein [Micromonospora sp. Llam0]|uniref:hypothetical protein n=1 Tax=Micromonospora sp. Llam0 TaxID=2485143 RepID=UPI0018F38D2D|nr:hypothetical protein [Micromonospora sp. Llam0]